MDNELTLVKYDDLLKKSFSVPGYFSKVISTWDLCMAEKVKAVPIECCKECDKYIPIEPVRERKGLPLHELKKSDNKLKAEWEPFDYDIGCYRHSGFMCSNCKTEWGDDPYLGGKLLFKYCPTCGAEMKEG